MSKHTPGPWRLDADPYEDGTPYFKFKAGSGFVDEGEGGFQFTAIISEADAKLIVAAPRLFSALNALADEAFRHMRGGRGHLIDEAYRAIADVVGRDVRVDALK